MTHVLTALLTDEECRALYDLLTETSHVEHDPFGAADQRARLSASREILSKLHELLEHPGSL